MVTEASILLVDDEQDILEFMKYNLEKEGYLVDTAGDGREAIESSSQKRFDLIIMDVMMPNMDGIEACREIRAGGENNDTLIAFLTARGEDYSEIAGFEAGADDYITKPIKPRVLLSRVKALLRRSDPEEQKPTSIGDITIDPARYSIVFQDTETILPRKEFELISLLASKPGRVFKREEIMNKIWGTDVIVGDRTIDVHIRKLRTRIGEDLIKTVKGVGYKLDVE